MVCCAVATPAHRLAAITTHAMAQICRRNLVTVVIVHLKIEFCSARQLVHCLAAGIFPQKPRWPRPPLGRHWKEGRDGSIKHTDGEINVSIEIKCYLLSTQKVAG